METYWFESMVEEALRSIINEIPNNLEAKPKIRTILKSVVTQSLLRGIREPLNAKIDIVEAMEQWRPPA